MRERPFGREVELAELSRAVQSRRALVSVTGMAGIGKTTLLQEFARGGTECDWAQPEQPWAETSAAIARRTTRPLIVDELNPDSGPQLATAVRQQSRRPLIVAVLHRMGLAHELVVRVRPFSAPEGGAAASDEPALQAFARYARRRTAEWRLSDQNVASVAAIVAQLGGHPLALRLAASRLGLLNESQIQTLLNEPFELLKSRGGDLQSAFQTTWTALAPELSALLEALTVFDGAFTLAAATAVVEQAVGSQAADLAPLLERLDDASLLLSERDAYRMPPLVRSFAAAAAGRVRAQAEAAYVDWVVENQAALDWPAHPSQLQQLSTALEFALSHARNDEAEALFCALAPSHQHQGSLATLRKQGTQLMAQLSFAPSLADTHLHHAITEAQVVGVASQRMAFESLADRYASAHIAAGAAYAEGLCGFDDRARAWLKDTEARDAEQRVETIYWAASACAYVGMPEQALSWCDAVTATQVGRTPHSAGIQAVQAEALLTLGDGTRAKQLIASALQRAETSGDALTAARTLAVRARLLQTEHDFAAAERDARRAMSEFASADACVEAWRTRLLLAEILTERARLDEIPDMDAHTLELGPALRVRNHQLSVIVALHYEQFEVAREQLLHASAAQRELPDGDSRIANRVLRFLINGDADSHVERVLSADETGLACHLRFVLRIARRRLFAEPVINPSYSPADVQKSPATLHVGAAARWFRTPDAAHDIDLTRRATMRAVLLALVEQREAAPGHALSAPALAAIVWPELEPNRSVLGRLYAAIAELRRSGLSEILRTTKAGYSLDPDLVLRRE